VAAMERRTGSCSAEPFWVDMVVGNEGVGICIVRCVEERRSVGAESGNAMGV
jgi:hypothetical protein